MQSTDAIAHALATAFAARDLDDVDTLVFQGSQVLGRRWRWLRPLTQRIVERFVDRPRPRVQTLAQFIQFDHGFVRACEKHEINVENPLVGTPTMSIFPQAKTWRIPAIRSSAELAEWLGITPGELQWFADLRGLQCDQPASRLQHYRYHVLTKRFGTIRVIEAPKPRLKSIQRRILTEVLDRIPPHDAAHGFRPKRSIRTFVTPHIHQRVVLKIDLQDFFPSIRRAWVQAMFRKVGYPEPVADLMGGLCTNRVPEQIWADETRQHHGSREDWKQRHYRWLYAQPHLPQGAPTSPALANLCAYRLDCRLAGLAHAAEAVYTRYADDLVFSAAEEFQRSVRRFQLHASATVLEEGFAVHFRKTRIMRQGARQQVAGVVINEHVNLRREDFDRLKAILTNCVRHGPVSQNRYDHPDFRAHLEGRVSFVESVNPRKGHKLRRILNQIEW